MTAEQKPNQIVGEKIDQAPLNLGRDAILAVVMYGSSIADKKDNPILEVVNLCKDSLAEFIKTAPIGVEPENLEVNMTSDQYKTAVMFLHKSTLTYEVESTEYIASAIREFNRAQVARGGEADYVFALRYGIAE